MKDKNLKYSILIKDLNSDKSCCINEEEVVPSASIIKLFIMAKTFQLVSNGELNLSDRISINKEERVPYSIIYVLDDRNTYTIRDLITLMIIQSDNTATNQLIHMLGIENINKFIGELGFKNTILKRKMMDFDARVLGMDNYTTAHDVAKLLELMDKGQLISKTYSDMMIKITQMQLDNSMMRINLDEELIVAHKTGDLPNIKHDVGIVYARHKHYIFNMLTWDATCDNYARDIIGKVSKISYEYLILGSEQNEDCNRNCL
ncbi:class A beta-lactamase-related serine hydrolase [Clostridium estertheticum]|uniref:serine hydrolase n=1 Tax=Clostridium estertheticum TaxID=238834 RepID=UPI001CD0C837|nr:serine hydrolase [Clostridium estertheticum]MBZ9685542.1 class A beta-lactamase-related serine hydrolase [Clostridium estertheticum]